ncbi:N-acyl homoserine lactonase family protein [Salinicola sp. MIT1003]|uniref:N-acyl homoserine lactonase family protein n=1 Tax=Salinicola sp. MIT1003 TaxID=1882734 RepID=UPI0009F45248|nr:N-acyl homoserine lactonase family protein [Salinicola sp. MIT1003]
MTDNETYQVYAIRYATLARKEGDNFIGRDPHKHASNLDFYIWVARSEKRTIIIDTGFSSQSAQRRGREFLCSPSEGLRQLGIDTEAVTDVILTHLHYDHAGNVDLFPSATFHLQESEMSFATGRYMYHPFLRHAYDVEDIMNLVNLVHSEKVNFVSGDEEIFPSFHVHHVGGHCAGLQIVRLWTNTGWMVLASDAAHYYENFERKQPFPIVYHTGQMLDGHVLLQNLATSLDLIIPGHDPEVMDRFPALDTENPNTIICLT